MRFVTNKLLDYVNNDKNIINNLEIDRKHQLSGYLFIQKILQAQFFTISPHFLDTSPDAKP